MPAFRNGTGPIPDDDLGLYALSRLANTRVAPVGSTCLVEEECRTRRESMGGIIRDQVIEIAVRTTDGKRSGNASFEVFASATSCFPVDMGDRGMG